MTTQTSVYAPWVTVTQDVAKRHPLYGMGGWLLALLLLTAAGTVAGIVFWLEENDQMMEAREFLGESALILYYAYMGTFWYSVALTVFALILAFIPDHKFPKAMEHALGMGIVATLLYAGVTMKLASDLAIPLTELSDTYWETGIGVALSLLLIWFFRSSARVNVTYRLRVRENDSILTSGAPSFAPAAAPPSPVPSMSAASMSSVGPPPAAPAPAPAPARQASVEERLKELKRLRDQGLVDEATYRERQQAIVRDL